MILTEVSDKEVVKAYRYRTGKMMLYLIVGIITGWLLITGVWTGLLAQALLTGVFVRFVGFLLYDVPLLVGWVITGLNNE